MTDDDDDDLFLPEPETREVLATIISVDDHLVEPADMFDGRLPARLQDRAVTLPERPHKIGYPSIFDEYWAPEGPST